MIDTGLVASEIPSDGPTFEQIALARDVIRRASPGPRFIGRGAAAAADEWLADRQEQRLQEYLRGCVVEVAIALAYTNGALSNDGLDGHEHVIAAAIEKALSNYELKQV